VLSIFPLRRRGGVNLAFPPRPTAKKLPLFLVNGPVGVCVLLDRGHKAGKPGVGCNPGGGAALPWWRRSPTLMAAQPYPGGGAA
jgi:hypothetical protein